MNSKQPEVHQGCTVEPFITTNCQIKAYHEPTLLFICKGKKLSVEYIVDKIQIYTCNNRLMTSSTVVFRILAT